MDIGKRKFGKEKILAGIVVLIYSVTIAFTIMHLCEYTESIYSTLKAVGSAKALLWFAVFLFTLRRVRPLNWQSLLFSVIYWPIAIWYCTSNMFGIDIETRNYVFVSMLWILGLVAVDMIVHGKTVSLERFHKSALVIYACMAISMMFWRIGKDYPLCFAAPFFLIYLIDIDELEWKRVIDGICNGLFISFLIIMIKSLIENPYVGERYYGCFVNIGAFGMFVGCVFVAACYRIYQSKTLYGRKSIAYIASLSFMVLVLAAVWMIETRTLLVGVISLLFISIWFIRKNNSKKKLLLRGGVLVGGMVIFLCIGALVLKFISTIDFTSIREKISNVYLLAPLNYIKASADYIFLNDPAESIYFPNSAFLYRIDLFLSGRLSLAAEFSKLFSFSGSDASFVMVGDYGAYNAHNTYVQMLKDFGYTGGGCFILWLFYQLYRSIKMYVKHKDEKVVFIIMWFAMTVGLLMGEMAHFFYPVLFLAPLITYPIMVPFASKESSLTSKESSLTSKEKA